MLKIKLGNQIYKVSPYTKNISILYKDTGNGHQMEFKNLLDDYPDRLVMKCTNESEIKNYLRLGKTKIKNNIPKLYAYNKNIILIEKFDYDLNKYSRINNNKTKLILKNNDDYLLKIGKIFEQLSLLLIDMNEIGFAHGDIKADNICIQDGKVALIDLESGKETYKSKYIHENLYYHDLYCMCCTYVELLTCKKYKTFDKIRYKQIREIDILRKILTENLTPLIYSSLLDNNKKFTLCQKNIRQ